MAPSILITPKYSFLDFKIILITKYEIKNIVIIKTIFVTVPIILVTCSYPPVTKVSFTYKVLKPASSREEIEFLTSSTSLTNTLLW